MNLVLTKERRFVKGRDGHVYTDNQQASGYSTLSRYLEVFDSLTVVGRLKNDDMDGMVRVTGPGINFSPVPHYLGPAEYIRRYSDVRKTIRELGAVNSMSAFITRSPGAIGSNLIRELVRKNYPFGMEVVGDPYDVFAPGAIRHPLRPLFRFYFTRKLKFECRQAASVAYVTEHSLQRRYPPAPEVFTSYYSNIHLEDDHFIKPPRRFTGNGPWKLIFVGTLAQLYKAPDTLIDAVGHCLRQGVDLKLTIIGDGRFRSDLEQQAAHLGDRVEFLGKLPSGDPIRKQLDCSDLFVLPSKGEGLPRAMIEAMARGLPCIGTSASGIPELLSSEDLVSPGDSAALAAKIKEVLTDPQRMDRMSSRNLQKAEEYRLPLLRERRIRFYRHLRAITEKFQLNSQRL